MGKFYPHRNHLERLRVLMKMRCWKRDGDNLHSVKIEII